MSSNDAGDHLEHPEPSPESIKDSELRAFRAWPAEAISRLAGWEMRFSLGSSTRRTNSVFAGPIGDSVNLDALMDQVESFYGNLELPSRFQVTPASHPADLEVRLDDRGYKSEGHSTVAWAKSADVADQSGSPIEGIEITDSMTDDWADLYVQSISSSDDPKARLGLFNRIRNRKVHLTAYRDGMPVSIGLGVFDGGWTGIFAMYTLPDFRRQGLAHGIIGALADWTRDQEGGYMYLQVEDTNSSRSIYERCGFKPVYHYHYRTLEN